MSIPLGRRRQPNHRPEISSPAARVAARATLRMWWLGCWTGLLVAVLFAVVPLTPAASVVAGLAATALGLAQARDRTGRCLSCHREVQWGETTCGDCNRGYAA